MSKQHIVLIGFKHVGKSVLGKKLAKKLHLSCIDLDTVIEQHYAATYATTLNCREISQKHGEAFFRQLETHALQQVLQLSPCIIALGGGAALAEQNQAMLKTQRVVYITAPRQLVFERIMQNGRPGFFPQHEDAWTAFNRLWEQREKIYRSLATIRVENHGKLTTTVNQILRQL